MRLQENEKNTTFRNKKQGQDGAVQSKREREERGARHEDEKAKTKAAERSTVLVYVFFVRQ